MKCPVCGAYNKSEYKRCYICSAKLTDEDKKEAHAKPVEEPSIFEKQNADRATLRQTITDGAPVRQPPAEDVVEEPKPVTTRRSRSRRANQSDKQEDSTATLWHNPKKKRERPFYIRKKDRSAPLLAIDDEEEHVYIDQSAPEKDRKSNEDKLRRLQEGAEVNVVVPPKPKKQKIKQKKKGLRWGRIVLSALVISAVLFGIVVGLVYTVKGISSGFSTIFVPRNPIPNNGEPLVERLMNDGQTWHRITFYGKDGERILVSKPKRTLTIHDGKAELLLDDFSYIPDSTDDNYGDEFVEVSIKALKVAKDGSEEAISVNPYNIVVPKSPLKVIHPVEQSLSEDKSQVLVRVKVTPGSRLIVGEKNLTDLVDSRGFASTYIDLRSGENDIKVVVDTAKHRRNEYDLLVEHPQHAVDFYLDNAPPTHQYDDVKISGLIEKGGSVYVDTSKLSAEVSYESEDAKYDRFNFKYALTDFGYNDIEMIASTLDGRKSTLIHRVDRMPPEGRYTRMAQALGPVDYDYLSSNTDLLYGRVYLCKGQIIETIETDTDTLYLFNTGTEEELRYVVIKYTNRYEIFEDIPYKAYADVIGTYLNYPLLHARFVYEDEAAVVAQESTPEPSTTPAADASSGEN